MTNRLTSPPFRFSDKINVDTILEMYGKDYPYIEIIFKTVLDHYDEDTASITSNYNQGQLELLRKAVHKMKPAFGYVGLPLVLEKCKNFEVKCHSAKATGELEEDFKDLEKSLKDAKQIIDLEHKKLVAFNSSTT